MAAIAACYAATHLPKWLSLRTRSRQPHCSRRSPTHLVFTCRLTSWTICVHQWSVFTWKSAISSVSSVYIHVRIPLTTLFLLPPKPHRCFLCAPLSPPSCSRAAGVICPDDGTSVHAQLKHAPMVDGVDDACFAERIAAWRTTLSEAGMCKAEDDFNEGKGDYLQFGSRGGTET